MQPSLARSSPFLCSRFIACLLLGVIGIILFYQNISLGLQFRQDSELQNPPYRVRQSLVIALSRFHDENPGGYVGLHDIERLFARNGLAIISDEGFTQMTPYKKLMDNFRDPVLLDRVFQEAATIPIEDPTKEAYLRGNEKGLSDFYYLAFMLFGLKVSSFFYFYYTLLGISLALSFITFRRYPLVIAGFCFYLMGHYLIVNFLGHWGEPLKHPQYHAVHGNRFFGITSVVCLLYFFSALVLRLRRTPFTIAATVFQAGMLLFLIWGRSSAVWGLFIVLAVAMPPLFLLRARGMRCFGSVLLMRAKMRLKDSLAGICFSFSSR